MSSSRGRARRGETDLDHAVFWVAGSCMVVGAAAGCLVGWLYGRDQASAPSDVPWYGAVGLVLGVVLGLLVSVGSILVLVAIDGRPWASAPLLRAVLVAAGAAVPITLLLEAPSGFSAAPEALAFCALVSALPAGIATVLLDRRTGRATGRTVRRDS
ncbi:MAG: hypothetical protein ACRYG2_37470 [Janthinobacterium lividum]